MSRLKRIRKFLYSQKRSRRIDTMTLSHYANMYVDDWHQSIIPFRDKNLKVEVQPNNLEDKVCTLLGSVGRYSTGIKDLFAEFVKQTAHLMVEDGKAVYEIAEVEDTGDEKQFVLDHINPESLSFQGDKVSQHIEKGSLREEYNYEGSLSELFIVNEPSWVESGKGFWFVIEQLIEESRRSGAPTNFMKTHSEGKEHFFSFADFNKQMSFEVLSLTNDSGWDIRQLANEHITEFYWIMRCLRFKYNQAKLREYIVDEVNNQLVRKLQAKGFKLSSITVSGIPTSGDCLERIEMLKTGELGFLKALDLD